MPRKARHAHSGQPGQPCLRAACPGAVRKWHQRHSCTRLQAARGAPAASAPPQAKLRRPRRRSGLPRSPSRPLRQLSRRELWPTMWLAPPAGRRHPSRQQPPSQPLQRPTCEAASYEPQISGTLTLLNSPGLYQVCDAAFRAVARALTNKFRCSIAPSLDACLCCCHACCLDALASRDDCVILQDFQAEGPRGRGIPIQGSYSHTRPCRIPSDTLSEDDG